MSDDSAPAAAGDTVYLEIPRRDGAFRVWRGEYKGRALLRVGFWYTDKAGELRPTAKATTVRVDEVPDVVEALKRAAADIGSVIA
jgi:hypothetical protein